MKDKRKIIIDKIVEHRDYFPYTTKILFHVTYVDENGIKKVVGKDRTLKTVLRLVTKQYNKALKQGIKIPIVHNYKRLLKKGINSV